MKNLTVFDLDGTLAELGKGATADTIALLNELSTKSRIAISSGKPTYYLCGFARQLGVPDVILIGENGCTVQFGVDLPPRENVILCSSDEAREELDFLKNGIMRLLPNVWTQPNQIMFTPFPTSEEEFTLIRGFVKENADRLTHVDCYEHCDSFDFVPHGHDKYTALEYLETRIGSTRESTIAVGDGVNDYPMFKYAKTSVGVHVFDRSAVTHNFEKIDDAISFIIGLLS